MHLVGFIIRIYHDAGSTERQSDVNLLKKDRTDSGMYHQPFKNRLLSGSVNMVTQQTKLLLVQAMATVCQVQALTAACNYQAFIEGVIFRHS